VPADNTTDRTALWQTKCTTLDETVGSTNRSTIKAADECSVCAAVFASHATAFERTVPPAHWAAVRPADSQTQLAAIF
jgi:hypothetical protein